jgi:hypothetical protein
MQRQDSGGKAGRPTREAYPEMDLKTRPDIDFRDLDKHAKQEAAAEAKERIEALGGRTTASVSAKTDYVVVGRAPGGKLDQAREHPVAQLDEARFMRMIQPSQGD